MTAAATGDTGPVLRDQVAEEVRAWLARRRMSGAELARRLGRSQTFIAKRLDGRQAMDLDDLQMIAEALRLPVTALFPDSANTAATEAPNRRYDADNSVVVTLFPQVRHAEETAAHAFGRNGEVRPLAS